MLVLRGKSNGLHSTSLSHGGGGLRGPKLVKFDTDIEQKGRKRAQIKMGSVGAVREDEVGGT